MSYDFRIPKLLINFTVENKKMEELKNKIANATDVALVFGLKIANMTMVNFKYSEDSLAVVNLYMVEMAKRGLSIQE